MAETSITGMLVGAGVFIFIILTGTLFVNSGITAYSIPNSGFLNEFNNSSIKDDLNTLELNIQNADAESTASQNAFSWFWSGIGKLLTQTKAIQNIIKAMTDISKAVTFGYIPNLLWWLVLFITSISVLMGIIAVFKGRKP